jgi:hypothetical protein
MENQKERENLILKIIYLELTMRRSKNSKLISAWDEYTHIFFSQYGYSWKESKSLSGLKGVIIKIFDLFLEFALITK